VWLLALVALMPVRMDGAPLSFGQALDLALTRYGTLGRETAGKSEPNLTRTGQAGDAPVCPAPLEDYGALAAHLTAANELGVPEAGALFAGNGEPRAAGAFELRSRRNVILCTALLYAKLEGIAAQRQVVVRQEGFVDRLIDIETRRVVAEVDHPVLLAQAKLLRARTRMESDALQAAEQKARKALAALLGLADGEWSVAAGAMPPLGAEAAASADDTETLQRLLAFRDVLQLDFAAEVSGRLKTARDMELSRVTVGRLVAAHVNEEMKLNALLQIANQVRLARIQLLGAAGGLEGWALGSAPTEVQGSNAVPVDSRAATAADGAKAGPTLVNILIAPNLKELEAGRSQQYSAIATYSNGHAADVTTKAHWVCSSDTAAVLSSTGVLTGLSPGEVRVSAEFEGLTHTRRLSIAERKPDEFIPRRGKTAR